MSSKRKFLCTLFEALLRTLKINELITHTIHITLYHMYILSVYIINLLPLFRCNPPPP